MKVLLVFPRTRYPSGDIPIGLSILGAILKKHGHQVTVFDSTFLKNPHDQFLTLLKKNRFDFMGLSLMTTMLKAAADFCRTAKQEQLGLKVIAGGPHPTMMPEQTLRETGADICVIGEGEEILPELIAYTIPDRLNGAAAFSNGEFRINPQSKPVGDLDSLPFPDFSLFDAARYISCWYSLDCVSPRSRGMNLVATRGCPFSCTFCQPTLKRLFGDTVRKHSPEYISALVGFLRSQFKLNCFMFEDDTFTADKNWCISVGEAIVRAHPEIYWGCNSHVRQIDEPLLRALKNSGLRMIFLGIESGSQRVLSEIYRKNFHLDDAREKIGTAKKLGLKVHAYFMLGAPTETEKEIKSTISFAVNSPIDEASFNITSPLPGTSMFDSFSEHIRIKINEINYYDRPAFDSKIAVNEKKLLKMKKAAVIRFYLTRQRPSLIAKTLLTVNGFKRFLLKLKRF
ncbi:MAG: radical SAM protein [bacterium]